jgi:hypothetical protein
MAAFCFENALGEMSRGVALNVRCFHEGVDYRVRGFARCDVKGELGKRNHSSVFVADFDAESGKASRLSLYVEGG